MANKRETTRVNFNQKLSNDSDANKKLEELEKWLEYVNKKNAGAGMTEEEKKSLLEKVGKVVKIGGAALLGFLEKLKDKYINYLYDNKDNAKGVGAAVVPPVFLVALIALVVNFSGNDDAQKGDNEPELDKQSEQIQDDNGGEEAVADSVSVDEINQGEQEGESEQDVVKDAKEKAEAKLEVEGTLQEVTKFITDGLYVNARDVIGNISFYDGDILEDFQTTINGLKQTIMSKLQSKPDVLIQAEKILKENPSDVQSVYKLFKEKVTRNSKREEQYSYSQLVQIYDFAAQLRSHQGQHKFAAINYGIAATYADKNGSDNVATYFNKAIEEAKLAGDKTRVAKYTKLFHEAGGDVIDNKEMTVVKEDKQEDVVPDDLERIEQQTENYFTNKRQATEKLIRLIPEIIAFAGYGEQVAKEAFGDDGSVSNKGVATCGYGNLMTNISQNTACKIGKFFPGVSRNPNVLTNNDMQVMEKSVAWYLMQVVIPHVGGLLAGTKAAYTDAQLVVIYDYFHQYGTDRPVFNDALKTGDFDKVLTAMCYYDHHGGAPRFLSRISVRAAYGLGYITTEQLLSMNSNSFNRNDVKVMARAAWNVSDTRTFKPKDGSPAAFTLTVKRQQLKEFANYVTTDNRINLKKDKPIKSGSAQRIFTGAVKNIISKETQNALMNGGDLPQHLKDAIKKKDKTIKVNEMQVTKGSVGDGTPGIVNKPVNQTVAKKSNSANSAKSVSNATNNKGSTPDKGKKAGSLLKKEVEREYQVKFDDLMKKANTDKDKYSKKKTAAENRKRLRSALDYAAQAYWHAFDNKKSNDWGKATNLFKELVKLYEKSGGNKIEQIQTAHIAKMAKKLGIGKNIIAKPVWDKVRVSIDAPNPDIQLAAADFGAATNNLQLRMEDIRKSVESGEPITIKIDPKQMTPEQLQLFASLQKRDV